VAKENKADPPVEPEHALDPPRTSGPVAVPRIRRPNSSLLGDR